MQLIQLNAGDVPMHCARPKFLSFYFNCYLFNCAGHINHTLFGVSVSDCQQVTFEIQFLAAFLAARWLHNTCTRCCDAVRNADASFARTKKMRTYYDLRRTYTYHHHRHHSKYVCAHRAVVRLFVLQPNKTEHRLAAQLLGVRTSTQFTVDAAILVLAESRSSHTKILHLLCVSSKIGSSHFEERKLSYKNRNRKPT